MTDATSMKVLESCVNVLDTLSGALSEKDYLDLETSGITALLIKAHLETLDGMLRLSAEGGLPPFFTEDSRENEHLEAEAGVLAAAVCRNEKDDRSDAAARILLFFLQPALVSVRRFAHAAGDREPDILFNRLYDRVEGMLEKDAEKNGIYRTLAVAIRRLCVDTEKLLSETLTDELTGAWNRKGFYQLQRPLLSLAGRNHKPVTFLHLDFDDFRAYNQKHGLTEGDNALRALAELIKKTIRKSDIVCRYGGDDFLVMLPETSSDQARIALDNIFAGLSKQGFQDKGLVLRAGGFTHIPKGGGEREWDAALKMAEDALLKARETEQSAVLI